MATKFRLPSKERKELERRFGHTCKDPQLLDEACTHASTRALGASVDNTRLALLGDAVLDLVEAHRIFLANPAALRGELTDKRQATVSDAALAVVAKRQKLQSYLQL